MQMPSSAPAVVNMSFNQYTEIRHSIGVAVSMLQIDMSGKLAVVTGGGRSIGRATADLLARCGARVTVVDRNRESINDLAGTGLGGHVLDVRNAQAVKEVFGDIEREQGNIDVLINCAGILQRPSPPEKLSEEEWDKTVGTNLKGTYLCCAEVGTRMVARKRGTIVNVASVLGLSPSPLHAYGPSKAAVISLTQGLAAQWGPFGVRVNAVAPGFTLTPPLSLAMATGMLDRQLLARSSALGRLLTAEEVATAIVFLASDLAAPITGITLPVDAGYLAASSWNAFGGLHEQLSA
jgi:NAD(P)-dependent dehydrogenase (short-subunit alcohol dehydrogenase family)